jgi:cytochrome P450
MVNIFSDANRRDPFPLYAAMRQASPVFRVPPPFDAWLVFDFDGVKRVLSDPATFSSRVPAPKHWFIFSDAPDHTRQRGLIAKAFTPRMIAGLEGRIAALSRELLDDVMPRGEMDLATDYAVPLPMKVIAGMIGIPESDWEKYRQWSDAILALSYTRQGGPEAETALDEFVAVTGEMDEYLKGMTAARHASPRNDLLTRLVAADVDGERLTHAQILGFFQLLLLGGQETTANLINNAILCFLEHPEQLARVRERPELLPGAIEEVLRYRSPLQWLMRTPTRELELHGQTLRPGELVLAMLGSANRDGRQFPDADRFDVSREPNAHLAFGYGAHFCLGAALSRLEARIALTDLLSRLKNLRRAVEEPWHPPKALHVHRPTRLPVRFDAP